jgi:hypothetical protein
MNIIQCASVKNHHFWTETGEMTLSHDPCWDCCGIIRTELRCRSAQLCWNTAVNREELRGLKGDGRVK